MFFLKCITDQMPVKRKRKRISEQNNDFYCAQKETHCIKVMWLQIF